MRDILKRVEADREPDEPSVPYSELRPLLEDIRRKGYHLMTKGVNAGAGLVGVMLPEANGQPTLALGIGGLEANITANVDRLVRAMRRGIDQYLT